MLTLGWGCSSLGMHGYSKRQLVRSGIPQTDDQAALWVCINLQDFLFLLCQGDAQFDAGSDFTNATFLVDDGDDLGIHCFLAPSLHSGHIFSVDNLVQEIIVQGDSGQSSEGKVNANIGDTFFGREVRHEEAE